MFCRVSEKEKLSRVLIIIEPFQFSVATVNGYLTRWRLLLFGCLSWFICRLLFVSSQKHGSCTEACVHTTINLLWGASQYSISVNPSTMIQNVKLVIDPSRSVPIEFQQFASNVLDMLSHACNAEHVANRGHLHEGSGKPEVTFYISHYLHQAPPKHVVALSAEVMSFIFRFVRNAWP